MGEDKGGMLAALHSYLTYCANIGIVQEIHPFLCKVMSLFPNNGMAYLESFTQQQIDILKNQSMYEYEKPDPSRTDFASKLLQMHHDAPEKISMSTVFGSCLTNIAAGSDTTSISLSAILYYLLRNPDKLSKVRLLVTSPCANADPCSAGENRN
jgi:hypothetical protein